MSEPENDVQSAESPVAGGVVPGPRGPMFGRNIFGEVTEALHRFLLDGWDHTDQPPRVEEDLTFEPKDREEVVYVYMYRVAQNLNLQNRKRLREAPVYLGVPDEERTVYYQRPPIFIDLFYLLTAHAKFRSDAERLLGWVMLRLHEATDLIYRPCRYILPDGREIDSLGRPYDPTVRDGPEGLFMEKVSLALVDDLTVGDGINLLTLLDAPYRPYLTYRARVALQGPVTLTPATTVRFLPARLTEAPPARSLVESAKGRIKGSAPVSRTRLPPGPTAHNLRPLSDKTVPEPEKK
jgi:hypothetical protein